MRGGCRVREPDAGTVRRRSPGEGRRIRGMRVASADHRRTGRTRPETAAGPAVMLRWAGVQAPMACLPRPNSRVDRFLRSASSDAGVLVAVGVVPSVEGRLMLATLEAQVVAPCSSPHVAVSSLRPTSSRRKPADGCQYLSDSHRYVRGFDGVEGPPLADAPDARESLLLGHQKHRRNSVSIKAVSGQRSMGISGVPTALSKPSTACSVPSSGNCQVKAT